MSILAANMSRPLTRSFSSQDLDDGRLTFRPSQGQAVTLVENGELVPYFYAKADVDLGTDSEDEIVEKITVFEFEIEQRCIKAEKLALTAEAMTWLLPVSRNLEKLKTKLKDHSRRCLQYATHYMKHVCFTTPPSNFDAAMFKATADFYEIEGTFNALKSFVDRYAVPDDDMDTLDQGMQMKAMKAMKASTKTMKAMKASTKKAMKASTMSPAKTKKAMKAMKASTKSPAKTMKPMKATKASMKKAVAKAKPKS